MVLILLFQIQGRDAVHEWPLEEVQYVLQTSGTQETRGSCLLESDELIND